MNNCRLTHLTDCVRLCVICVRAAQNPNEKNTRNYNEYKNASDICLHRYHKCKLAYTQKPTDHLKSTGGQNSQVWRKWGLRKEGDPRKLGHFISD